MIPPDDKNSIINTLSTKEAILCGAEPSVCDESAVQSSAEARYGRKHRANGSVPHFAFLHA
jgi:hypothetical protein